VRDEIIALAKSRLTVIADSRYNIGEQLRRFNKFVISRVYVALVVIHCAPALDLIGLQYAVGVFTDVVSAVRNDGEPRFCKCNYLIATRFVIMPNLN